MHWLLAGYMWLYIHRPFEVWPWLASIRIERIYMIATICCWLLTANKGWVRNRLNVGFAAFFLALLASWVASPFRDAGTKIIEDYAKVAVFYVLVMSCIRDERKLRFIVAAFLACVALYMAHSLWEYRNGRYLHRMGTARMIGVDTTLNDPNSFAASLVYALPLTIAFWRIPRSRLDTVLLLCYTALTVTCILLTGSRGGFVGLLCVGLILLALSRYRFQFAIIAVAAIPIVWAMLPADRQQRYFTIIDPSYGPANAKESADARQAFFNIAVGLWKKSPVLAYGPGAFPLASEEHMQVHSLYGQLFAEVGLVGMATFAGVLVCFLMNARDIARHSSGVPWKARGFPFWLSIAVLVAALLLLILGLSGHNLYRYTWLWYGAFQGIALHCVRRQSVFHSIARDVNGVTTDGSSTDARVDFNYDLPPKASHR